MGGATATATATGGDSSSGVCLAGSVLLSVVACIDVGVLSREETRRTLKAVVQMLAAVDTHHGDAEVGLSQGAAW